MSAESKELRLASLTLLLPLYIAVVFAANYFGALHAPKPHGVKVAIVGAPSSTARIARQLSIRPRGGFDVSRLTSIGQARELVGARKLAGAYVPGQRPAPVIVVATAASASLATFVEASFRELAAARNRPLVVDDLGPLPANNASESPNFFFIVICTLGGFLTVTALGFAAPTLPEPRRLGIVAAASLLAPIVAYLIGGAGYDTFTGSVGAILAMLGLGALYAFAVAGITRLLQLGLGGLGTLIGSLVLIFLNVPSSGGSVAAPLLPGFWRFLSHFWIGAAALDANRSALYFGGSRVANDVLKMLAWVAAWACLLALPIHLRSTRRVRESLVSPNDPHEQTSWRTTSTSVALDGSAELG
ncbi:MAG: hypothetical protein ACXVW5_27205 [Solirubrobacteraceae bacterium]